jgi:hypothetical protein
MGPHFTFWGEWLDGLTSDLGIEEAESARGLESMPLQTYGDLIMLLDRLLRQSNASKAPINHVASHALWDRALDG